MKRTSPEPYRAEVRRFRRKLRRFQRRAFGLRLPALVEDLRDFRATLDTRPEWNAHYSPHRGRYEWAPPLSATDERRDRWIRAHVLAAHAAFDRVTIAAMPKT